MTDASKFVAILLALATALIPGSSALAQSEGERLFSTLSSQLNDPAMAGTAPKGHRFSGLTRGSVSANERQQGVIDKIHVVVSAGGQAPAQREGFSYHVLASPQAARTYFELFAAELFFNSPLWPRDGKTHESYGYDVGPATAKGQPKLRCNALIGLFVCRFHDPALSVITYIGGADVPAGGTSLQTEETRIRAFVLGKGTEFLIAARYHLEKALAAPTSSQTGRSSAAQCEAERLQVVTFLDAQDRELKTIPIDAQGNPATPAARIAMCAHVRRSVIGYGKGLDQLNRCGGTDNEKAGVAQLINKMSSVVSRLGCEPIRQ